MACCPKGKCRRHTDADIVDLVETYITKGYLKVMRKKNHDEGLQNVTSNCSGCEKEFYTIAA